MQHVVSFLRFSFDDGDAVPVKRSPMVIVLLGNIARLHLVHRRDMSVEERGVEPVAVPVRHGIRLVHLPVQTVVRGISGAVDQIVEAVGPLNQDARLPDA